MSLPKPVHEVVAPANQGKISLQRRHVRRTGGRFAWLMLSPALSVMVLLIAYPLFYLVKLSLTNTSLLNLVAGTSHYVGVDNFRAAITDPDFVRTLEVTFVFVGLSVTASVVAGTALGITFNRDFRARTLFLSLCMLPMLMTPVVIGLFWKLLLNGEWGVINYLLKLVGFPTPNWLVDERFALLAIVMVVTWLFTPFVTLVVIGAAGSQSPELYEAARLDGASELQIIRYVTLPLLRRPLYVVSLILTIEAVKLFDIIFVLTGGGPAGATRVLSLEIYERAFRRADFSFAAAEAVIVLLLTALLTMVLVRGIVESRARSATR